MTRTACTFASHIAFSGAVHLGLNWLGPKGDVVLETTSKDEQAPGEQRTSQLLPGFVSWFVDGMKMEARAERWY